MSYEPTLIIKKSDLEKHRKEIENYWMQEEGSEEEKILSYLNNILKFTPVKIDDLELLVCRPELSNFNRSVREQLLEWSVTFGESD